MANHKTRIASEQKSLIRRETSTAEHFGLLLWQASTLFVDLMLSELTARGYAGLTRTHMHIFPVLDPDGTRITVLAERIGVSKQAIAKLVDDIEERGYVKREPDLADGRAKMVKLSATGRRLLRDGEKIKQEIEKQGLSGITAKQRQQIDSTLQTIVASLSQYSVAKSAKKKPW